MKPSIALLLLLVLLVFGCASGRQKGETGCDMRWHSGSVSEAYDTGASRTLTVFVLDDFANGSFAGPIPGARVSYDPDSLYASTNAQGVARLERDPVPSNNQDSVFVSFLGYTRAVFPIDPGADSIVIRLDRCMAVMREPNT